LGKKNLLFEPKRRTQIGECKVKKLQNIMVNPRLSWRAQAERKPVTNDQEVVNWASSVDPFSAVVEEVPPEMTIDTSSK
jgi:hypothetical protein